MFSWTCPYCGQTMHSAYDRRDQKELACIYCHNRFKNLFYQDEREVEKYVNTIQPDNQKDSGPSSGGR